MLLIKMKMMMKMIKVITVTVKTMIPILVLKLTKKKLKLLKAVVTITTMIPNLPANTSVRPTSRKKQTNWQQHQLSFNSNQLTLNTYVYMGLIF